MTVKNPILMNLEQQDAFKAAVIAAASCSHNNALQHGFWGKVPDPTLKAEKIALMHSELSEMLEGVRKPTPDSHCPEFSSEAVEAADLLIRLLDYCMAFHIPLTSATIAKMQYNSTRPFKHGKAF